MTTTSYAVVDSSVFLERAQAETYSALADQFLAHLVTEDIHIAAPVLLHYEIAAVARKWVYRNMATPEQSQKLLDSLLNYPVALYATTLLVERAYHLATELALPTAYDSQYLAVAEHLRCDFWTLDKRLLNAVSGRLHYVKWLGDWEIGDWES